MIGAFKTSAALEIDTRSVLDEMDTHHPTSLLPFGHDAVHGIEAGGEGGPRSRKTWRPNRSPVLATTQPITGTSGINGNFALYDTTYPKHCIRRCPLDQHCYSVRQITEIVHRGSEFL